MDTFKGQGVLINLTLTSTGSQIKCKIPKVWCFHEVAVYKITTQRLSKGCLWLNMQLYIQNGSVTPLSEGRQMY